MSKQPVSTTLRGFTLIELLVVIAIIGILSAVVLVGLNVARTRGIDAAIKSNLTDTRKQAEIYYTSNSGSYLNVCLASTTANGVKNVYDQVYAAARAFGLSGFVRNNIGAATRAVCNDGNADWAAQVPLKELSGSTQQFFCVDNKGRAVTSTSSLLTSGTDRDCQ